MSNFEPYVDPFAAYVETPATGGGGSRKVSNYESWKLVRLQRWNLVLRVVTVVFTLAAIFSTLFANEYSSKLEWRIEYKYFTAFQFVLYTNAVVCLYAVLISVFAIIMRSRIGLSQTASLMTTFIILNSIACVFLLLAFAAGTATEIISRNGWHFTNVVNGTDYYANSWTLCTYYSSFCVEIELGLGLTALAFLSLATGTGIDVYYKITILAR